MCIQRNCVAGEIGMKLRITSSFCKIRCYTVLKYVYCSKGYNRWKTSEKSLIGRVSSSIRKTIVYTSLWRHSRHLYISYSIRLTVLHSKIRNSFVCLIMITLTNSLECIGRKQRKNDWSCPKNSLNLIYSRSLRLCLGKFDLYRKDVKILLNIYWEEITSMWLEKELSKRTIIDKGGK